MALSHSMEERERSLQRNELAHTCFGIRNKTFSQEFKMVVLVPLVTAAFVMRL